MNRRRFLGALVKGAVAVSIAANIPAEWIPVAEVRECVALEYLRRRFNDYCGQQLGFSPPSAVVVGNELFMAAQEEMLAVQKFSGIGNFIWSDGREKRRNMLFKGVPLVAEGRGWRIVRFEA